MCTFAPANVKGVSPESSVVATFSAVATMVIIAQLVRASDCGSEGRGFESHWSPDSFTRFFLLSVLASLFSISF